MKKNIFMFDVESDGLYGKGFCFGAVVSDRKGNIIDSLQLKAVVQIESEWVRENVIPNIQNIQVVGDLETLRTNFYEFYMKYKDDCDIYSDCNFPVETNFLTDVVMDDIDNRQWDMPYPLMDVATAKNINIDREKFYTKKNADYIAQSPATRNLKKHNPLDDAIASLCLLLKKKIYYNR